MESTNVRGSVRLGACGNSLAPELWPSWGAGKCTNLYFLSQGLALPSALRGSHKDKQRLVRGSYQVSGPTG